MPKWMWLKRLMADQWSLILAAVYAVVILVLAIFLKPGLL